METTFAETLSVDDVAVAGEPDDDDVVAVVMEFTPDLSENFSNLAMMCFP